MNKMGNSRNKREKLAVRLPKSSKMRIQYLIESTFLGYLEIFPLIGISQTMLQNYVVKMYSDHEREYRRRTVQTLLTPVKSVDNFSRHEIMALLRTHFYCPEKFEQSPYELAEIAGVSELELTLIREEVARALIEIRYERVWTSYLIREWSYPTIAAKCGFTVEETINIVRAKQEYFSQKGVPCL